MRKLHKPIYQLYGGRDSRVEAHAIPWLAAEIAAIGATAAWAAYNHRMQTGCWHEGGSRTIDGSFHEETWACAGSLFNSVCTTNAVSVVNRDPC